MVCIGVNRVRLSDQRGDAHLDSAGISIALHQAQFLEVSIEAVQGSAGAAVDLQRSLLESGMRGEAPNIDGGSVWF
jgi:hypothetical protein